MSSCMPGWTQVPGALLDAPISDRALRLWIVLEQHQRGNGSSWPSRAHLADHLSCSRWSLERAIAELEASGWLQVKRSAGGRTHTNRYVVVHNGGSPAPDRTVNGCTTAPDQQETGAPLHLLTGAPVHPRSRSRETDSGTSSAQGETARVCELGRLIAADGSCCPDHHYSQAPMWPVAVNHA